MKSQHKQTKRETDRETLLKLDQSEEGERERGGRLRKSKEIYIYRPQLQLEGELGRKSVSRESKKASTLAEHVLLVSVSV